MRKRIDKDSIVERVIEDPKFQNIISTIVNGILYAILAGVVTAALIACFTDIQKHSNERIKLLKNIGEIYIGSSKEWIDANFGPPNFTAKIEDYVLCAYFSDISAVQIIYDDSSKSTQAFFVTSLSNKKTDKLHIVKPLYDYDGENILGEASYYDIPGTPQGVLGYVSNGTARAFYGETYYYNSSGNYYNYYYLSLDYGELKGTVQDFISSLDLVATKDDIIDDEVSSENILSDYFQIIRDRKNAYPNTYGVSGTSIDFDLVVDIISDYSWFDSKQIRDRNSK